MIQSSPGRRVGKCGAGLVEAMEGRRYLSVSFGSEIGLGGFGGTHVAIADLNGDQKPDVVEAASNFGGSEQVEVFVNQGGGVFGAPIYLPYSASSADAVAIGDFNGDGVPDIAVESANDATVSVYLGAGSNVNGTNPSFLTSVVSSFGTAMPGEYSQAAVEMQTAHFGGSMDDLVVLDGNDSGTVRVLLASGGGHFAMPTTANILANQAGQEVDVGSFVIADLNGDGISDIAIETGGSVDVQFGASGGSFLTTQFTYSVPDGAEGDIDAAVLTSGGGTNLPDLVVESGVITGGDVSVLLNNGAGSFGTAQNYPVRSSLFETVGDFDGDGSLDIFAGSEVLLNDGAGTFAPAQDVTVGDVDSETVDTSQLVAADLNDDAHADVVDGNAVFLEGASNGGGGGSGSTSPISVEVTKSTLPPKVVTGAAVHDQAILTVDNTGSTTQSGNVTVALYASADGFIDGSSVKLGSVTKNLKLKGGAHAAIPIAITSVPSNLLGRYTLVGQVTDSSGNTSLSGAGPVVTAAGPFVSFSETLVKTTLADADVSGQKSKALVQMKITNSGNVSSTGQSTIAFYFSQDTVATDGTLIRSVSESVVLKPGASRVVNVPLVSLPSVADGDYYLDIVVTDPNSDVTTLNSSGRYALAAPFISLVPSAASAVNAKNGTATISFTVTNDGNVASVGAGTIDVNVSADGTLANSEPVFSEQTSLALAAGKKRTERVRLTTSQVTSLQGGAAAILEVTDPLGGSQSLTLSGV